MDFFARIGDAARKSLDDWRCVHKTCVIRDEEDCAGRNFFAAFYFYAHADYPGYEKHSAGADPINWAGSSDDESYEKHDGAGD